MDEYHPCKKPDPTAREAKGGAVVELIVDNFAGGGGASTGIELATGRSVDIAINHDPAAIAMHRANHPATKHYCENVWDVDPVEACAGRPVGLAWFSPDCKHFSKAKGGKPVEKAIRGLAWVAIRWAKLVRPRVIILENVEEFTTWGPLIGNRPDPMRKGQTFRRFVHALKRHGYRVEWNELRACDYGAPTIRKQTRQRSLWRAVSSIRGGRRRRSSTGQSRARASMTARSRSAKIRCGASREGLENLCWSIHSHTSWTTTLRRS